jgi:2-C-methyl-D-erythritol 4-phosphate cytidylyltransferase/2-C-methyl-D-erythritol 2,4-cyclodiphosphate synthase
LIAATLGAAAANGAGATAAVPVADTLIRDATGETVDREGLWAVQTPQAFRVEILVRAHRAAERDGIRGTDDAGLVRRMSLPVALVPGDAGNLKVTRPADLDLAAAVLARRDGPDVQNPPLPTLRVGHGYDVHPFSEGRKLFLGGVEFPEAPRGLLGHSDADVLLHALCDALLGAAGMGDIGALFPDNDPAHKDRPSVEFLRAVRGHLDGAGFRVGNVDMTVLAETPRVGPRAGEIKACVAGALGVAPDQVGLKATTNEGMGFVGRGEGIAAYATALIYR